MVRCGAHTRGWYEYPFCYVELSLNNRDGTQSTSQDKSKHVKLWAMLGLCGDQVRNLLSAMVLVYPFFLELY